MSKRLLEVAMKWAPSGCIFGAAAGLGLVYATDWKVIALYIPFYGGKFKENQTVMFSNHNPYCMYRQPRNIKKSSWIT